MIYVRENINSLGQDYFTIMNTILTLGTNIAPRNNEQTLEIRPSVLQFSRPINRMLFLNGRDINPFFLVVESLWILSGREEVYPLDVYNSRISNFSDDGMFFHAPYGKRLRSFGKSFKNETYLYTRSYEDELTKSEFVQVDQLRGIYDILKVNKDSRQAVASIWNPFTDLNYKTKDIPCNDTLFFKIRDGKLNLTIANRSNDFHWGLPTNLFQFSTILEIMAYTLGVRVGEQTHLSDSLHIYLDNPITERVKIRSRMLDPYMIDPSLACSFSLNENYLLSKKDMFDKVFEVIEETMLCIENFKNDFLKLNRTTMSLQDMSEVTDHFSEIFFVKNYLYQSVTTKSLYLSDLIRFSLCYFLYKEALTEKDSNFRKNLFVIALNQLSFIMQKDYLLLGLNFMYTRFNSLFKKEDHKKLAFEIKSKIKDIAVTNFIQNEFRIFVKESDMC